MNKLKKTIWFDQNSEPQKSYIWYRGEGKFYEYSGGNWVLAYDLANTPTQSELESIADKLSDGSEETVDANIGSILNALSDKIDAQATILETVVDSSLPDGMVVTITDADLENEITEERCTEINRAALLKYDKLFYSQTALMETQYQQIELAAGDNAELIGSVFAYQLLFDGSGNLSGGMILVPYSEGGKLWLKSIEI